MSSKAIVCQKCGAEFQLMKCQICDGKGFSRGVLKKHPCNACKGTGLRYQCPNWRRHLFDNIREPRRTYDFTRPGSPSSPSTPFSQPKTAPCPLCKGAGGVPHPFTGAPGPCPRCGGTGRVKM